MASGIGWGTVHWSYPLRHRLAGVLVLLTVLSVPLLLIGDVWVMVPFVVLAGVAVSPSLISSFTLAELLVPRAAVTEAFTWIGTALGLGVAVGASVAGKIVDVYGANAAFLVATVAAGSPRPSSGSASGCCTCRPSTPPPPRWPAEVSRARRRARESAARPALDAIRSNGLSLVL